jgi:membrane protease YdiL (CAAX protease family)
VGSTVTILLSGVLFALLHAAYGNLAPDNTIAGFVLAWAYLRSSSLLVPIVLHALGNLCVFGIHVALFYA